MILLITEIMIQITEIKIQIIVVYVNTVDNRDKDTVV